MGRRKQTPVTPSPEPENESQEPPTEDADQEDDNDRDDQDDQEEPGTSGTISKTEAVRQAIEAGHDQPSDGVPFIKTKFGIDMKATHFSATKSQLKKREGQGGGTRGRGARAPEVNPAPPPKRPVGGDGDLLEAMASIKGLVQRLGKDQVKKIVDLLG